jgi:NADH-quinone oxidoreductase subunit N
MTLDGLDLIALLPLLVAAASAVLVMLASAFFRSLRPAESLTLLGLLLSCAALPLAATAGARQVTALLLIDHYALYYMGLVFGATFVVAVLCRTWFGAVGHGAHGVLLLLAALGGAVLAASSHFASLLLGLELYSIALFALIAWTRDGGRPLEAAIKYLILSGFSSAFLLFGMALIYADLGTMQFAEIGARLAGAGYRSNGILLAGFALILVGVGFKLALAPFHMWIPDIYEGAPPPVAALVATVSKGAVLALLLRYAAATGAYRSPSFVLALSLIAIVSIMGGNLLALLQENVKRILAYSSIAQLGYLLVALLATGTLAVEAIGYFLAAYFVTMLGAFGVVTLLSAGGPERDKLSDYHGLFWRRPWLAASLSAMLLSLAGIPLTMGFVGKFYIVAAAIGASLWLLVIVLVAGSTISLFYYLRIIAVMCSPPLEAVPAQPAQPHPPLAPGASAVLAALVAALVWLGAYPAPLMDVLAKAALVQAAGK